MMHVFFLLSEGIGSLEHSFDTQLQNLTQMQGPRTVFACGTANEVRKDKRGESNVAGFFFLEFDYLNG